MEVFIEDAEIFIAAFHNPAPALQERKEGGERGRKRKRERERGGGSRQETQQTTCAAVRHMDEHAMQTDHPPPDRVPHDAGKGEACTLRYKLPDLAKGDEITQQDTDTGL